MNSDLPEARALDDEQAALSLQELHELSGLAEEMLHELIAYGVVDPIDAEARSWTFGGSCITIARRASRLQRDFDLDAHAVAVVLGFIARIDELQAENRALRAKLPA